MSRTKFIIGLECLRGNCKGVLNVPPSSQRPAQFLFWLWPMVANHSVVYSRVVAKGGAEQAQNAEEEIAMEPKDKENPSLLEIIRRELSTLENAEDEVMDEKKKLIVIEEARKFVQEEESRLKSIWMAGAPDLPEEFRIRMRARALIQNLLEIIPE